jgi:alkylation response protein AidB-like acyl-CoA dehydrogenase
MDFELPNELQMLKQTLRNVVGRELIPIEMHSQENNELKPHIRSRLEKKQRYGSVDVRCAGGVPGRWAGKLAQVVVWEEICRSSNCMPPA